jgi:hypothetical protein
MSIPEYQPFLEILNCAGELSDQFTTLQNVLRDYALKG